jgi:hypothetical protein
MSGMFPPGIKAAPLGFRPEDTDQVQLVGAMAVYVDAFGPAVGVYFRRPPEGIHDQLVWLIAPSELANLIEMLRAAVADAGDRAAKIADPPFAVGPSLEQRLRAELEAARRCGRCGCTALSHAGTATRVGAGPCLTGGCVCERFE